MGYIYLSHFFTQNNTGGIGFFVKHEVSESYMVEIEISDTEYEGIYGFSVDQNMALLSHVYPAVKVNQINRLCTECMLSYCITNPTIWALSAAMTQISLGFCPVRSESKLLCAYL